MKSYFIQGIILCFFITISVQAKNNSATIEFNAKQLNLGEPFIISVVISDSDKRPVILFPEIAELEKRSKSATSEAKMVNGKRMVIQTIRQEYFATKAGKYIIPDFTLLVNGEVLVSEETEILFIEDGDNELTDSNELLPTDNITENVFFSVRSNKSTVFIRQGFTLRVSLFISESAPVEMDFYQFNDQFQNILKSIRPMGCWEENTGMEEIVRRKIYIKEKAYTEYIMFNATFFPLKLENIKFPSVGLNMLVVDRMGTVNVEKKVIETFNSKPFTITVKQLPPHHLRDQVPVGEYILSENLTSNMVLPGESVKYKYKIQGKGNIVSIPAPGIILNSSFDFYPPEISHIVTRNANGVSGEKSFEYIVVPRSVGLFPLKRYFQWIYFDPVKSAYDTLQSSEILEVRGKDSKQGDLSLNHSLGIYDNIEKQETTKVNINYKNIVKNLTNAIAVCLLLFTIWIFRKQ